MRHLLLTSIFWACATGGCDDGAQQGRFAVSGTSSRSLSGVPGSLMIVRGDPLPAAPQSTGQQPLLYVLAVAPSMTATRSGSSHQDGRYVSTYTQFWDTPQGRVTVELSWDRRTDQVSAAGATFDRRRGNTFVLARAPTGAIAITQVGTFNVGLDPFDALPPIQAALPADSPAKDVALAR